MAQQKDNAVIGLKMPSDTEGVIIFEKPLFRQAFHAVQSLIVIGFEFQCLFVIRQSGVAVAAFFGNKTPKIVCFVERRRLLNDEFKLLIGAVEVVLFQIQNAEIEQRRFKMRVADDN